MALDMAFIRALVCLLLLAFVQSFAPRSSELWRSNNVFRLDALTADELAQTSRDLTGYSLWVKFDGFGVEGMTFGMELRDKFAVRYSRGIESQGPGFWRVVKYTDGRETVEATQPIKPEYMFFFDIWEKSILWRGELDMVNKRVVKGEVITNKKRFGIFPYTETLATFEADLLEPNESLPDVVLPDFSAQKFVPPDDFVSPLDMERYPDVFDAKFRRWFFAVEEALAKGETPPTRPVPYFTPSKDSSATDLGTPEEREKEISGKSLFAKSKNFSKSNTKGGKGF